MKVPSPIASLLQRVGVMKKRQMPLSRDEAFEARPVRNPRLKWRINEEGHVEVVVPRRKDFFGRVVGFLFFVPENRPIVLDEVGTRVWELCDGENTVSQIVNALAKEYKLGRREVEASLTEYLKTLGQRGMVGFLIPEEFVEDEDEGELVGLQDVGTTREDLEAAQAETRELEDAEPSTSAALEEGEVEAEHKPDEADEASGDQTDDAGKADDEREPLR